MLYSEGMNNNEAPATAIHYRNADTCFPGVVVDADVFGDGEWVRINLDGTETVVPAHAVHAA